MKQTENFAFVNEALTLYGAELVDGVIHKNGKNSGVRAELKGKKLRFIGAYETLLFTGAQTVDAVSNFVESYWYWKKK